MRLKRKLSAAKKGRTHSEETKAKIRTTLKGNTLSEETKVKMSASRKGAQSSQNRENILLCREVIINCHN
jgi:hypothetical protein